MSMSESPEALNHARAPERRLHTRLQAGSLLSIDLSDGNSTIVLNIGEGGLGLRVAATLAEPHVARLHLQLPISQPRIEIDGEIAWVSESRREVGIRFVDLHEETRGKLRDWVSSQSSPGQFQKESAASREGQFLGSASPCRIRGLRLDQDLTAFVKSWKECHSRFPDRTIHGDPDWIQARFKQENENVWVYFAERDAQVIGAVPFVLSKKLFFCQLGESIVAKLPMRVLNLQGYAPNIPDEEPLYDLLFDQVLKSEFDAIQLSHVRTASFLWSYLSSSPLIRRFFSFYTQDGPLPHPLIHLNGSFESYMKKFSAKARKNRLREIRKFRERGNMQFIRATKVSEIDALLEGAYQVAQKTRQFVRYGWGIASRDFDVVRDELRFLAQRGWLRAYLLKSGTVPCSFILGQQYGSTFYTAAAGVDPAWREYSPGTVLLLLVLEDLFTENSPRYYDLDNYVKYKNHFANESYPEAFVWLFRRRAYPLLASSLYAACNLTSRKIGAVLDHLHLKSRVKRLMPE